MKNQSVKTAAQNHCLDLMVAFVVCVSCSIIWQNFGLRSIVVLGFVVVAGHVVKIRYQKLFLEIMMAFIVFGVVAIIWHSFGVRGVAYFGVVLCAAIMVFFGFVDKKHFFYSQKPNLSHHGRWSEN
jgi:hypothetical protein